MYDGKYLGTFGDINAWSFCQDKIMTTGGEGGMVTTNNTQLYEKAWSYKDHGKSYQRVFRDPPGKPGLFRWVHETIGTNWRMTEMQAAIGLIALQELDTWLIHRRTAANIYDRIFSTCPELRVTHTDDPKFIHACYKYYCFVKPDILKISRDELIGRLIDAGIPVAQGTCGEVNLEKAFDCPLDLPVARQLFETSLMFQTDPTLSFDNIETIAKTVCRIIEDSR
jgi:dTDP-4-amino-4,6-dideoxygalactose transaminase